jgi:hypothetical protein
MAKIDRFPVTVPFAGFYCSVHDEELEHALERMFDREGDGRVNSGLVDAARDAIDWRGVHEAYAARYVDEVSAEFDLNLTFDGLESPKYYNYETDRIFAYIDRASLAKIARAVPRAALRKAIKDRFTSRSGFISHYDNDLSAWPRSFADWDHNQIGTLLEIYLDRESEGYGHDGFDSLKQYYVMESPFGNGYPENWFFENARRGYENTLNRLLNIAEYLDKRAARPIKTLYQWHAARRAENRPFAATPLGSYAGLQ